MIRRRFLSLLPLAATAAAQQNFDVVITGGTVVDGSGGPARPVDVGIRGGRIAAIGDLKSTARSRTIDAKGLVVAPGFIDMHNHSDDTLVDEPKCESMIRQGVTTMVLGEGGSAGPIKPGLREWATLGEYFDFVAKRGVATNIASYVGQTQIWTHVKGYGMTDASPAEVTAMGKEVAQAMRDGAMGLSSSLLMPPSSLMTTPQLVELAKVAKQYGGIYSTHIRDEGLGVFRSVEEAIAIGKGANIRVDIIHLKVADQKLCGQMKEVISMIDKARGEGFDIRAHVYPYTAGQNNLRAIIPPWAHDGGNQKMLERLRDPALRTRMKKEILEGLPGWYNHYSATGGGWQGMILVSLKDPKNKPFVGKRMSDLLAARGGDPVETFFDILLEENGSVPTVFFHHSEADMTYAMKQPYVSIGSDGSAMSIDGPQSRLNPHPRSYGTFARVLGRYVREQKAVSMEAAIQKMTSLNADKINLKERGLLKEGYWADVAIFDPKTIADRATFDKPHQYAVGMAYVLVNGKLVLEGERHTGALPGQVLRGPGYQKP
ncbi:MAG: D-aminoacylase [Acidobacteria bacterium]|nr:D-aminoacylase [Acidobacteriota bacterium]